MGRGIGKQNPRFHRIRVYRVQNDDIPFIPLETVSKRTDGYGPGGHPKPGVRDYSLAWDKGTDSG